MCFNTFNTGFKCPGFPVTVNNIRIKLDCLFGQIEHTSANSYWNKNNPANNKMPFFSSFLLKITQRKCGHPVAVETLASWLDKNGASLHEQLGNGAAILDSDAIVVWDTESEGVGGTHSLELMRKWVFIEVGDLASVPWRC
ncbi:hypothetical protein BC830DRAFT_1081677 [Chytriomyces sp. MP71]|nr:hypothetical protein BC830DRAFT_1081677 [Chytriomyces sp. MP71]